jgi:hypothetical protein
VSGKWFTNRGQIVQTISALVSVSIAGVALYFVLKSNNSLPGASAVLYFSGALFFVLIGLLIGRRSRPPASLTTPLEKEIAEPNLMLVSTAAPLVHRSGDKFYKNNSIELGGRLPEHPAVVAEIKNASRPNRAVGVARSIKAELRVTVGDSQQMFGPLAWTETISNTVSIEIGEAKDAILAVRFARGIVPDSPRRQWRIATNPRSRSDDAPGAERLAFRKIWNEDEVTLRLNLLHVPSGKIIHSFEGTCHWENDAPVFVFRPKKFSLIFWRD